MREMDTHVVVQPTCSVFLALEQVTGSRLRHILKPCVLVHPRVFCCPYQKYLLVHASLTIELGKVMWQPGAPELQVVCSLAVDKLLHVLAASQQHRQQVQRGEQFPAMSASCFQWGSAICEWWKLTAFLVTTSAICCAIWWKPMVVVMVRV